MKLDVLTLPHCPGCTKLKRTLEQLKSTTWPALEYEMIDVSRRDDLVEKYQMTAAPTIVFPDGSLHVGSLDAASLYQLLCNVTRVEMPYMPESVREMATAAMPTATDD